MGSGAMSSGGPPPASGRLPRSGEESGSGLVLIEGYASLFGVEDLAGDVVRAGAFARTLARGGEVAMLLQHRGGAPGGRWTTMREDGRGLYVRGLVNPAMRAGAAALKLVREDGLRGLSIGFVARDWSPRVGHGRELRQLELREVSLVMSPMLPGAGFAAMLPGSMVQAA